MERLGHILRFFYPVSGRLSRSAYVRRLFHYAVMMMAVWLLAIASKSQPLGFIALAITAMMIVSGLFLAAQRCRDLGWPGWAVLFTIVPWGGELLDMVLYFRRGMPGANRYGPDPYDADGKSQTPPPNT